jgi:uncharacterized protein (TIGR02996 family)
MLVSIMAKIRLELDGRPGSFFEAEVKGPALHVAFGPRDRLAPTKARPFPSEATARAELERLVGLHRAKGYAEKVEAPPKPAKPTQKEVIAAARARAEWLAARQEQASRPASWKLVVDDALLAACEAAPDDPAPWHVYADCLAAGGDPRGELALGYLSDLDWEAGLAIPDFLGPVTPLEIRHGFVRTVSVGGDDLLANLTKFLATPFAASLRMLRVGLGELGDWTPALAAIAASPAGRRLRELEFDASDHLVRDRAAYDAQLADDDPDEEEYDDYADYEDDHDERTVFIDRNIKNRLTEVSPVRFAGTAPWSELVALERLVIDGPFRGDLGKLALPALRELVIRSDRFSRVADLASATCPRLETLEIWFGDQVWSGEDGALDPTPLFDRRVLPSLKTLRVFDADDVTHEMIRESKLAKRVKLVTAHPEGAHPARYAHPQREDRTPLKLPRNGEPPKQPKPKKPRRR